MVRRKIMVKRSGKSRPEAPADYIVHVTAKLAAADMFFGELSLVRLTDGRKLHPFDGAAPIGPFPTFESARAAAAAHATKLIEDDIRNPE